MEFLIKIDEARCVHCGRCIKDCSTGCLEFDAAGFPVFRKGDGPSCFGCQHCLAVCPVGAVSFGGLDPADSEPAGYGDAAELLRLMKSRRSVRDYKPTDLPAEALAKIREMLAYPPTGRNADCLHFSIVGTREKMEQIVAVTREGLKGIEGNPFLHFLSEAYENGHDVVYRGAPSMVVATIDPSQAVPGCVTVDPIIALSYLELYAASLGLGTLWCNMAVEMIAQIPALRELLEIPEGYELGYVLLVGEPAVQYARAVQKEPPSIAVV